MLFESQAEAVLNFKHCHYNSQWIISSNFYDAIPLKTLAKCLSSFPKKSREKYLSYEKAHAFANWTRRIWTGIIIFCLNINIQRSSLSYALNLNGHIHWILIISLREFDIDISWTEKFSQFLPLAFPHSWLSCFQTWWISVTSFLKQ